MAGLGILLLCVFSIAYPFFGFYFSYFICLFLVLPSRVVLSAAVIPTGLIPEYFSYLTLLAIITKQNYRKEIDNRFWSNAITLWMLVLLCYYVLELFNPYMGSKLGWFNFFRKQVSLAAFFYISYCFFNSRKAVIRFTRFWIILATIEALYACKQQWFGFFHFEYSWLTSDPERYNLFVNWGFMRKFGLLSDPAAAGILYACTTVLVIVMALRAPKKRMQVLYMVLAIIHFLASSYTGTRTATMMIVAGITFYCILTLYEKKTLIFSVAVGVMLVGLLTAPIYNNVVINRVRSTFEGSSDPSAMIRDVNRHFVQPYVYRHPIGGGIFTAGLVGTIYNPGHYLSFIPPDSGFMQIMMEEGPIGLALTLIFYYVILRQGIKYFYRVRDPDVKTLYVAHLVSIFTLLVAQFSQLAIGQYPSVLYLYSAMAIMIKLHQYDSTKPKVTQ